MENRLMFRVGEAADSIGISRAKAYELIRAGVIPSVQVGSVIRVPVDELRAWIAREVQSKATAA